MDVEVFDNPRTFCDTALPFLYEAEAENNLLIGISSRLAAAHPPAGHGAFFWTVRDGDRICGAAMQTPPHDLVLSHPFPDRALAALSDSIHQAHFSLPGVLGPDYAAREFAAKWASTAAVKAELWRRERIYRLQKVEPLPFVSGRIIAAELEHVVLLTPWVDGFLQETRESSDTGSVLEAALAGKRLFVWFDAEPVSMAAWTGATRNGVRINTVYTPPHLRRRGYATAVVSVLSSMLLREGKSFCALYTDLSNPTSNSIYQRIGYKPILDCFHYRFSR